MNIESPLGILTHILEQVRLAARKHESKLKGNEAITRAVLIDPVVRALGWDTANPDMVEFERYYQGTKLDYALNDADGNPVIIVEAKALGSNLNADKVFTTILTYGITYKIPSVFLTDGLVWKHYKLETLSKIDPFIFDLRKDSLVNCAMYLTNNLDASLFWSQGPEQARPIQVFSAESKEGSSTWTAEVSAQKEPVVSEEQFVPLSSLDANLTGRESPKLFRLPDGTVMPLQSWRDILLSSINFLLSHHPSLSLPLKDKAGKKAILVDYQKMGLKGVIKKGEYQGKEVFIYLNYDANHCVSNALFVLSLVPSHACKVAAAVAF